MPRNTRLCRALEDVIGPESGVVSATRDRVNGLAAQIDNQRDLEEFIGPGSDLDALQMLVRVWEAVYSTPLPQYRKPKANAMFVLGGTSFYC